MIVMQNTKHIKKKKEILKQHVHSKRVDLNNAWNHILQKKLDR